MSNSPLQPDAALLCKLGSIARHAQELLSDDGHSFDRIAMEDLLKDKAVVKWMKIMDELAMLPMMRKQR